MNSELFKLKTIDFIKGIAMFVLASVVTFVYQSMTECGAVDCVVWADVIQIATTASLSYLLKNLLTAENGKIGGVI